MSAQPQVQIKFNEAMFKNDGSRYSQTRLDARVETVAEVLEGLKHMGKTSPGLNYYRATGQLDVRFQDIKQNKLVFPADLLDDLCETVAQSEDYQRWTPVFTAARNYATEMKAMLAKEAAAPKAPEPQP